MPSPHDYRNSFVVRIWIEETVEEAGAALWRGHITHVQSGFRQYIDDLAQINVFIEPYLRSMYVRFNPEQRLWWWLTRLHLKVRRYARRRRPAPPQMRDNTDVHNNNQSHGSNE